MLKNILGGGMMVIANNDPKCCCLCETHCGGNGSEYRQGYFQGTGDGARDDAG